MQARSPVSRERRDKLFPSAGFLHARRCFIPLPLRVCAYTLIRDNFDWRSEGRGEASPHSVSCVAFVAVWRVECLFGGRSLSTEVGAGNRYWTNYSREIYLARRRRN